MNLAVELTCEAIVTFLFVLVVLVAVDEWNRR